MSREQIHFVTGRLAEYALRKTLTELAPVAGFDFTVEVLPITVAALMTPDWIARHMDAATHAARIILPGYCHGDLSPVAQATQKKSNVGRATCDNCPISSESRTRPPRNTATTI